MTVPTTMRAVRLQGPGGPERLALDEIAVSQPGDGEALVRVRTAAITRDELSWHEDRFPAIPSFEVSGTVAAIAPGLDTVAVGDPVFALLPFERDGAAAEYVVVAADLLVAKPEALDDVQSAAVPLAALSAWQGLFVHGGLEAGQRVLILGAGGGVGQPAVQLARSRGAHVIGSASPGSADLAREAGADEVIDHDAIGSLEPVDLVFDTVGGDALARSAAAVREGGSIVTVAEEPPNGIEAVYFVVEPDPEQLGQIRGLADRGELRPSIDSTFPLEDARAAFERSLAPGKRGKVVLTVAR